jgi:hypothetical protein
LCGQLRLAHSAGTHCGALARALWSCKHLVLAFALNSLDVLLVLNFLFNVLVALEDLVVLDFSHLQALVHLSFKLFLQRSHFVRLLAHHVGLTCENFLMNINHVLLTFFLFKLLCADLDLMSLLIALLLGHLVLDLSQVEQLSGLLVLCWQGGLQVLTVVLQVLGVLFLHGENLVLVVLLSLLELVVPVLIEVLVLLNVGLFAFFALLLVHEDQFLLLAVKVLLLKLSNAVLCHLGLDVATLAFASGAVLLHRRTTN